MSLFDSASLIVTPNAYKAGKLYSLKPTDGAGDLSVTRATTATRVNSEGLIESVANNIPRLDYSNGSCPSILVEPQRTNLLTWSEDFTNADWNKFQATITSNSIVSPDSNTTADRLTSSANGSAVLFRSASTGAAVATLSVYAKAGTNDILDIGFTNVTDFIVKANLTTGTIVSATSGITGTITNVGNGWYRVTATRTMTANGTLFINSATNVSGRFLNIWGAQLEAGANATSYIKTVASAVTRNADVISKTGISDLIGQTEGVMYFDLKTIANNNFKRLSINGGSFVNSIFFDFDNTNALYAKVFNGGSTVATLIASGLNMANRNKIAIAYKNNDFSFYVNGVQVASQSSGSVPSGLANYEFSLAGNEIFEGNINTAALWKTRLSNTQLSELTTI